MPSELSIFGVTLHLYGLLIGVGIVVAAVVAEIQIKKSRLSTDAFWNASLWLIVGGVLGARLWHVFTDWHIYKDNVAAIAYIWNGGLSIIGALMGGLLVTAIVTRKNRNRLTFFQLTDALAIGLPFGQAIGRIGNWINQELYGFPTEQRWKIYIDEKHRLPGYERNDYYHPLFAYESIGLIVIGAGMWLLIRKNVTPMGSGKSTFLYLATYSWLRFFLEFLRIDKAVIGETSLGINQVIMLLSALGATIVLIRMRRTVDKIA